MSEKKIDVFFVDIGKVLVNFDNSKFYEKLAGASGVPVQEIERLDREVFKPLWPKMETSQMLPYDVYRGYRFDLADIMPAIRRAQFKCDFTFSFFKEASASVLSLKPKVLDFIKYLRGLGCKVVLTSNTYSILSDAQRSLFPQIFSNADGCIFSHEIGFRKPNRTFWFVALDEVKWVFPDRVFVVDDMEENIHSAKSLGMHGAVFTNVENLKKELNNFGFNFKN
ncbi:MAG: HAD-IA family hydrolase [Candidatus Yanofskybacteria bacterium]|nr:HAD-IA family hydrolase [Candidatus Yanofskybacteria bacterium]